MSDALKTLSSTPALVNATVGFNRMRPKCMRAVSGTPSGRVWAEAAAASTNENMTKGNTREVTIHSCRGEKPVHVEVGKLEAGETLKVRARHGAGPTKHLRLLRSA